MIKWGKLIQQVPVYQQKINKSLHLQTLSVFRRSRFNSAANISWYHILVAWSHLEKTHLNRLQSYGQQRLEENWHIEGRQWVYEQNKKNHGIYSYMKPSITRKCRNKTWPDQNNGWIIILKNDQPTRSCQKILKIQPNSSKKRYLGSQKRDQIYFFKLGFISCKAGQPLRGMKLQEKETQD